MGIPMRFQQLKERPINYVEVILSVEDGCDPEEGEYSMEISGFTGRLDLNSPGGTDDISLIKYCVEDKIDIKDYPKNGQLHIVLRESGEWEGYSWFKYYEIERICKIEY